MRALAAPICLLLLLTCPARDAHAGWLRDRLAPAAATEAGDLLSEDRAVKVTLPPGTRLLRDLPYGRDPRQAIDVYLPAGATSAPLLVMVHGGGWRQGDKAAADGVDNKIARWLPRGIAVVSVNYRLLPQAAVAQQAVDVAAALAFVQSRAAAWGADPDRIVLMGHSAGAHLAGLLAADPARVVRAGGKAWLGTVALDSAAIDVEALMTRRHLRLYDAAFGQEPATWRALSPLHQLGDAATPLLLVCSSTRRDQPCSKAQAMVDAMVRRGKVAQLLPQQRTHREINTELGLPGAYTEAVERFMAGLDAVIAARLATGPR